ESLSLADVIEREPDIAGQLEQELHLRRVEESDLRGIERQHAHCFIGNQQWQHHKRMQATLFGFLAELDARVLRHVLDDHRLALSDRLSCKTASARSIVIKPQRHQLQIMLVGALPGHGSDFSCRLVHHAQPRQLKSTCLYRNAARFPVELLAVPYPDDKRVDAA